MTTSHPPATSRFRNEPAIGFRDADTRVVFLTNQVAPYWKPVFVSLAQRIRHFRVLVSTPVEPNRRWSVDWSEVNVVLQKTITLRGRWRHPAGFSEPSYIHLPIDTLRHLISFSPNVVFSSEMGFRTLTAVLYRKLWGRNCRLIVWADVSESTEKGRGLLRAVSRKVIRRSCDAFVVPGNSGARYLSKLGIASEKIVKVPYATDVHRFAGYPPARPERYARRLLFVGQLIERKGLIPFLTALSKWAAANPDRIVEFTLCGDGPLRGRLESLPIASNLRLTFLGHVPHHDLPSVYAESGIFVFPTLADCWGVAVNEAMASGLPVLGSANSQAVAELAEPGRSGWIFRPDISNEVDLAIAACMNTSAADLSAMRICAQKTAARLSPDYIAGMIDALVSRTQAVSAR